MITKLDKLILSSDTSAMWKFHTCSGEQYDCKRIIYVLINFVLYH